MLIRDVGDSQLQNSCDFNVNEYSCFETFINSVINNDVSDQSELFYNDLIRSRDKIKTEAMSPEHSFQQKAEMKQQQVQPQQNEQLYFNFGTTMDYNQGIYPNLDLSQMSLHQTNIKHNVYPV